MKIQIASRTSPLALLQTNQVISKIQLLNPDCECSIVEIRSEGDLTDKYRLNKLESEIYPPSPQGIIEDSKIQFIKWQLVKLNNKPIENSSTKPYFIHLIKDNQFSAFVGCNSMFGEYKLENKNKITFSVVLLPF